MDLVQKVSAVQTQREKGEGLDKCRQREYNIIMKKMNLYLAEPQIKALQALSKKTGISVSEHIRRAISDYLNRKYLYMLSE